MNPKSSPSFLSRYLQEPLQQEAPKRTVTHGEIQHAETHQFPEEGGILEDILQEEGSKQIFLPGIPG